MTTVTDYFNQGAQRYDQARRQLLPCFDDLYGVALGLLPAERTQPLRVLDLGAGTGLLAALIATAYPQAHLTLIDAAAEMLAQANQRMQPFAERCTLHVMDMRDIAFDQPFDLIVSALAIHHLADATKQAIFRQIYRMLAPGGRFVHIEQVLGPTPAIEAFYEQAWLQAVQEKGVSPADLAAAQERMQQDQTVPLATQLRWLAESGFQQVHCWYQWYRFVVYSGDRG
jgi:tRNA (cmo5U34)-methyltransferase